MLQDANWNSVSLREHAEERMQGGRAGEGGGVPSKTVVFVFSAKKVEGAAAMNRHRRRLFGSRLRRLFTSRKQRRFSQWQQPFRRGRNSRANTDVDGNNHQGPTGLLGRREEAGH